MEEQQHVIALAGNPNVGKSTIFNGLTGMHQHTGNWPGKTVASARGEFQVGEETYELVDLPGTYSLAAHSEEEEIARDFICSGEAKLTIVVCDATCLERGLHLLKQILGLDYVKDNGVPVILCVNLCDEAGKKGIEIDFDLLQDVLQIPVVSCCARCSKELTGLKNTIHDAFGHTLNYSCLDFSPKRLAEEVVRYTKVNYRKREDTIDRIVTGRITGGLVMILMLLGVFWLTMAGANYPADLLWNGLFWLEGRIADGLSYIGTPQMIIDVLVYGVYRVLAWVVAVKGSKSAMLHAFRRILYQQVISQIRFVRAVLFHCFKIRNPCKGRLGSSFINTVFFKYGRQHIFDHCKHVLLCCKCHLHVHLIKFARRAVCTGIFIPKAWRNLEIAVKAGSH